MSNEIASDGFIFVCLACGKRSKDKYGFQSIDYDWDESCMMNSKLIEESKCIFAENGRVIKILD